MKHIHPYYQGKTALVTGAATGIGQWLCLELVKRGCKVAALDIQQDALQQTVDKGQEVAVGMIFSTCCDVTDNLAFGEAVKSAASELGGLDFMFNNAGIKLGEDVSVPLVDRIERLMDINLLGQIYGTLHALDIMREKGTGHIVNTASISGLVPIVSPASYTASKHGVVGFSLNIRNEVAALGVRVSIVCPSGVSTPMMDHVDDHSRLLSPEQFAKTVLDELPRGKALIVKGAMAKRLWVLYRISPSLFMKLASKIPMPPAPDSRF
jgi:NAD(P)-dependent dehydrogenase (short-subunit alcohol dehydrogenase family)